MPLALQITLDKILHAIANTKSTLQSKIDSVAAELGLLRADHASLSERVKTNEGTLVELQPAQKALQLQVDGLTNRVQVLENRAEDAEGRSRRNNVRIVGLPEKVEGNDMIVYLEEWVKTSVAVDGLSPFFALERAHWVPTRPPAPGRPPRPVIARLLHFRDQDTLLQKARTNGPYTIDNAKVSKIGRAHVELQSQR